MQKVTSGKNCLYSSEPVLFYLLYLCVFYVSMSAVLILPFRYGRGNHRKLAFYTTVFQVLASMQIYNYRDTSAFNTPFINIINDLIFLIFQIEKLPLVPTRAPRGPEQFVRDASEFL